MTEDFIDRMVDQWRASEPTLDTDVFQVVGRLLRCAEHVQRAVTAALRPFQLSYADFDVLNTLRRLAHPHGTHPRDLACAAMVTSGAMTARVDRLQRAGLVGRGTDPDDGRAVRIRLTARGESVAKNALARVLEADEEFLAPLSGAERATTAAALRALLVQQESR